MIRVSLLIQIHAKLREQTVERFIVQFGDPHQVPDDLGRVFIVAMPFDQIPQPRHDPCGERLFAFPSGQSFQKNRHREFPDFPDPPGAALVQLLHGGIVRLLPPFPVLGDGILVVCLHPFFTVFRV